MYGHNAQSGSHDATVCFPQRAASRPTDWLTMRFLPKILLAEKCGDKAQCSIRIAANCSLSVRSVCISQQLSQRSLPVAVANTQMQAKRYKVLLGASRPFTVFGRRPCEIRANTVVGLRASRIARSLLSRIFALMASRIRILAPFTSIWSESCSGRLSEDSEYSVDDEVLYVRREGGAVPARCQVFH